MDPQHCDSFIILVQDTSLLHIFIIVAFATFCSWELKFANFLRSCYTRHQRNFFWESFATVFLNMLLETLTQPCLLYFVQENIWHIFAFYIFYKKTYGISLLFIFSTRKLLANLCVFNFSYEKTYPHLCLIYFCKKTFATALNKNFFTVKLLAHLCRNFFLPVLSSWNPPTFPLLCIQSSRSSSSLFGMFY